MVCDKCGVEVSKKDKFCPKCGAEMLKAKKKKKDIPEVEEYKLKDKEIEKLSQSFASRDEKYIASLGNGYIMNYLVDKEFKKGFAFLTDKRVYFIGSCLSGKGKTLIKTDEERTVDVKNITGSGFVYWRYWGRLVALIVALITSLAGVVTFPIMNHYGNFVECFMDSVFMWLRYGHWSWHGFFTHDIVALLPIVSLPLIVICCIGIKNYLFKRKTLFRIEYAGGYIAFDVSFYAKAEIDDFQKQLRRVKDFAEEAATIRTVSVDTSIQAPTQNGISDELRKYADLLKEGLISQEEYDAMKKKILGL